MSEIKVNSIKGVGASTAAITVNNTDGTCTANITNNLSNRNKVINGAMTVSQRNGDQAVQLSASEQYIVDRFKNDTGSSFDMKADASQSTDSPDGFSNSLKLACDGVSTPTGSHNGLIVTFIEGQDLQDLAFGTSNAKAVTLSFYAKSASQNNGHVYGVQLGAYLNGSRNSQTKGFTITSSWQRFTMTFAPTGTVTSTPILNNNSFGMMVGFCLGAGADDLVNYSTWTADTGLKGFTGQDNFFDNTSNEIYITGVQLEVSDHATSFEHRSFAQELALCQRYFYMHASGAEASANNRSPIATGAMYNSGNWNGVVNFPVKMRTSPSLYKVEGTDYFIIFGDGGSDGCNSVALEGSSPLSGIANLYGGLAQTSGTSHWGLTNNSAARLGFQAEL